MKSVVLSLLVLLAVCLNSGLANEFTEDDFRHMKMMFCGKRFINVTLTLSINHAHSIQGVCKDETVRQDLIKFGKCAVDQHEAIAAKVMGIRDELKNDHDACFSKIFSVLQEYGLDHPEAHQQAKDCFHGNVKKEDLDKCH